MNVSLPDFNKAFRDDEMFVDSAGQSVSVFTHEVGKVRLPTGRVVACDPLAAPEWPAFKQRVTPGSYSVVLSIGCFGWGKNRDERVACAMVRLSQRRASTWKMALTPGQQLKKLKPDHLFGYPVDSGTGCFMDAEARNALCSQMDKEDDYFEKIIEALEVNYQHTRNWADFAIGDSGHNMVAFSTGFGDGLYASYWGLDREGALACLVTDFGVLPAAN